MAVTVKSRKWRRPHLLACSTSESYPTRPQRQKSSPSAYLLAKLPTSSHLRGRTRWVVFVEFFTKQWHASVGGENNAFILDLRPDFNFFVLSTTRAHWIHSALLSWAASETRPQFHTKSWPRAYCVSAEEGWEGRWHLSLPVSSGSAALFCSEERCHCIHQLLPHFNIQITSSVLLW